MRGIRIRVLLDTAAVRGLIHGSIEACPLERLDKHTDILSFALADNAVPELVLSLYEGRLPWESWASRVDFVGRLLDRISPIFPDDVELKSVAVVPVQHSASCISRADHARAIWNLLRYATGPADLTAGSSFVASDGVEYRIQSDKELAERISKTHHEKWKQMIMQIQSQIVGYHPTQEHIAELQFKAFFGGNPNESILRHRHDGYVKSLALFMSLALQRKSPYNPLSDGRRGDSFDIQLLTALALPALICTLDGRLKRHVVATKSPQAIQLVSPKELLEGVQEGTLGHRIISLPNK